MTTERIDIVVSQRGAKEVRRDLEGVGTGAKKASAEVQYLKNALTLIGVGTITREVVRLSDAYTTITNRLKIATRNSTELAQVQKSLFDISQRTRSEFTTNVQLYNRLAIAAKELGANQKTMLTFTEAVGNALAIGGGTIESTRGALIQLSQAVGTTIVRAEEFNSILEGAPRIAQAAATGFEKAGGSVAKLRFLIVNGKVSSKEFFDAVLSQAPILAEEFAKTTATISQSFTVLENSLVNFAGKNGAISGGAKILANAIIGLSKNVETLGNALIVVAGFAAGKFIVNLAKAGFALVATEVAAFNAARQAALLAPAMLGVGAAGARAAIGVSLFGRVLGFLGGPIGIAATVVLTAIAFHTDKAEEAQLRYSDALEKFGPLADKVNSKNKERAKNAKDEANNIIQAHIAELSSLNLLIDGYTQSSALVVGLKEIFGKIGIGTAPSEALAQADKLSATIKEMRELLKNPPGAGNGSGTTPPEGSIKASEAEPVKSKAEMLSEENMRIEEQIRLLGFSADAREVETSIIEIQRKLRESGYSLSQAEEDVLRTKISLYIQLNKEVQAQEDILNSIRGPQEDYARYIKAANDLLQQGKISTKEYAVTVRDLRISMLDTATDAASGFERGLLKIRKEFEDTASLAENVVTNMSTNMEDALVEFAKTGKLSFKGLIDSMIEDIIRLQARRALISIFDSITGGSSGGGSGLGSLLSAGASLLGGAFGGADTSAGAAPIQGLGQISVTDLPAFATGGGFTVPGSGGVDSQTVAFRASPGERVDISRPGENRRGGGDTFNVVITTPTPDTFRQSENQIAAQMARAIAKSKRNS